jgi:hypothetical protein
MAQDIDPFIGTWKLNPGRSDFDPNHRPTDAVMVWEREPGGHYLMTAEGTMNGKPCAEKPQRFIADANAYPVPDFPGLSVAALRPDPNTIRIECRREDGSLAGQATYTLSEDGRTMAATNSGFDSQLREFRQYTVWDRDR